MYNNVYKYVLYTYINIILTVLNIITFEYCKLTRKI